jgi:hypothetical protein
VALEVVQQDRDVGLITGQPIDGGTQYGVVDAIADRLAERGSGYCREGASRML